MIKHNQDGAVSGLAISELFTIMLLVVSIGFGMWAYSQMQDYKKNVDVKIAAATETARQTESAAKTKEFAQKEKSPLKPYVGPEAFGSITLSYPKTWSGYVDTNNTSIPVDGYWSPGVVPSVTSSSAQNSVFALRVQVLQQTYAQILESLRSQQQGGKLTFSAYALPKLPKIVGVRVSGQLNSNASGKTVTMVIFPLRSNTIQIFTEGSQYLDDFNNSILPNISFSP